MFQNNFQNPYAALMGQTMYNQPQNNQQFFQPEPTQNLIMYVKSTDGAGFPSIRTFSFTELKEDMSATENTDYISRQEFEEFKKELMNNGKQSISRSKSNLTTDKSTDN